MAINLGDEVRDVVTGFRGIATGRSVFLHGCSRIAVQPKVVKDGKMPEAAWFDEPQLEVVKAGRVAVDAVRATGGPLPFAPPPSRTGGAR